MVILNTASSLAGSAFRPLSVDFPWRQLLAISVVSSLNSIWCLSWSTSLAVALDFCHGLSWLRAHLALFPTPEYHQQWLWIYTIPTTQHVNVAEILQWRQKCQTAFSAIDFCPRGCQRWSENYSCPEVPHAKMCFSCLGQRTLLPQFSKNAINGSWWIMLTFQRVVQDLHRAWYLQISSWLRALTKSILVGSSTGVMIFVSVRPSNSDLTRSFCARGTRLTGIYTGKNVLSTCMCNFLPSPWKTSGYCRRISWLGCQLSLSICFQSWLLPAVCVARLLLPWLVYSGQESTQNQHCISFHFLGLITCVRHIPIDGGVVLRDESGQRTFNLAQVFSSQLSLCIFTGSVYVVAPRVTKKGTIFVVQSQRWCEDFLWIWASVWQHLCD